MNYTDLKKLVRKLKLRSISDYQNIYDKNEFPFNVPKDPSSIVAYKSKWKGWKDFLGK